MSVRFCLSYGLLKWDFIAFKVNIISIRKHIVDKHVVNDVTCTRKSVITHVVIRFLWYGVINWITETSYDKGFIHQCEVPSWHMTSLWNQSDMMSHWRKYDVILICLPTDFDEYLEKMDCLGVRNTPKTQNWKLKLIENVKVQCEMMQMSTSDFKFCFRY